MEGLFQWIKLSQALVETEMGAEMGAVTETETETGTMVVIGTVVVIMEVDEEDLVETASNVASLVILPGNAHLVRVQGVDMVEGMTDMEVAVAMGLIVMEIVRVDATGMVVVAEDQEMIDTTVIVQVHMSVLEEVIVDEAVAIIHGMQCPTYDLQHMKSICMCENILN